SQDELLVASARVIESALAVPEIRKDGVHQSSGSFHPFEISIELEQGKASHGEVGVVVQVPVEHAEAGFHLMQEPLSGPQFLPENIERLGCRLTVGGIPQYDRSLGERIDHETVPGSDHFIVFSWRDSSSPDFE